MADRGKRQTPTSASPKPGSGPSGQDLAMRSAPVVDVAGVDAEHVAESLEMPDAILDGPGIDAAALDPVDDANRCAQPLTTGDDLMGRRPSPRHARHPEPEGRS